MAKSTTATGITCEEGECWKRWTGTREELIETGICTADQFPEGRKRVLDNYGPEEVAAWWCTNRRAGGIYVHQKHRSQQEVEAYRQARCDREFREEELTSVRDPQSFREFMRSCAETTCALVRVASGEWERERAGEAHLWLEAEAYQRLLKIQSELMAIVENSRICERRAGPALRLVKGGQITLSSNAERDPGFQKFLVQLHGI